MTRQDTVLAATAGQARPKIFDYPFSGIYDAYLAKVTRKGRSEEELITVITWMTGWSEQDLARLRSDASLTLAEFFAQAPGLNPARELVTGSVCGVKVQEVTDPTMRLIRQLDKLVDELAKGRPLATILRSA